MADPPTPQRSIDSGTESAAEARSSDRRGFLTGRAAAAELEAAQNALADRVLDTTGRPVPGVGDTVRIETRAMACVWQIMLPPGPPEQVMVASEVLDEVHELERLMTVWRDDGVLKQLNDNSTLEPVGVPEPLFEVIARGVEFTTLTDGCFDVTSGPLVSLWRNCRASDRIPTQDEIDEARSRCGIENLELDATLSTVRRKVLGMEISLGAIGKGYALDRLATQLETAGLTNFLVHGGHSTIVARGRSGTHDGWPVALRNPLQTERQFGTVLIQNEALSSSGSNVQYFRHRGCRYGHLLDPRTGWPAETMLSATVTTESAAASDAFSTAIYVGGLDFADRLRNTGPHEGVINGTILTPTPTGRSIEPVVAGALQSRFFPQDVAAATIPTP